MGLAGVAAMFKYMIVVMLVLIIHGVFVYGGLLKVLAKESIVRFFKHFGPVMAIDLVHLALMHLFHLQ